MGGHIIMEPRLRLISLAISIFLLLFVLELVRRKRLKEKYSLLWLLMSVVLIITIAWPRAATFMRDLFGLISVANTILLIAVLFITILCIHFSVRISVLSDQVKLLAQEVALLKGNRDGKNGPTA
jgi:hypothetical protein